MNIEVKARFYYFGIFFIVYIFFWTIIHYVFQDLDTVYVGVLSVVFAVFLSPQKQIVRKQSGRQIQLKWIFSKKVIIIK